MLSTRPQFHWTDQKLRVHAFLCVTAYLLATLLHRRARRKAAYEGGSYRLLAELAGVRCCRLIEHDGPQGKATRAFADRGDRRGSEDTGYTSGCSAKDRLIASYIQVPVAISLASRILRLCRLNSRETPARRYDWRLRAICSRPGSQRQH
jgi:hypothetical protein